MPTPTPARFPLSFFEYNATFVNPAFLLWARHGDAITSIFGALSRFGFDLGNIKVKDQEPALKERTIRLDLPVQKLVIEINAGGYSLNVNNPNWNQAEFVASVAEELTKVLFTSCNTTVLNSRVSLAIHIIPEGEERSKIALPFIQQVMISKFLDTQPTAYGFSVAGEDYLFVMEASAVYPDNGIFVRLIRNFKGAVAFSDVSKRLFADEQRALETLGLYEIS